jgi:hypothetical protein
VVDFVGKWTTKAGLTAKRLLGWVGLASSKYHAWAERYGKANEHNGPVPRDHWLTADEKQAIVDFHRQHPLEGYRRLTYLMIDRDVVACAPASVYRVLAQNGLLSRWKPRASARGAGFDQPSRPHEHWHVDVSYLNLAGTLRATGATNSDFLVRAIGPSLSNFGIQNPLSDPTLELHDGSGTMIASNDNWKTRPDGSSQQAEIEATGIPPTNDLESALLQNLGPGAYTAIVRGRNSTTGVGLVEVYNLQ